MTEQAPRRIFSGLSEIMDQLLSGETVGESLRVAKILDGVNGVLEIDDSSSSSSIRRLDTGTVQITIGAVPFRTESIEEFGWGVEGAKEQMLVKLSHETAHAFQSQTGYEQALVDFLNGSNNIDEKFHPYIELYTFLNSKGVCNGLADSEIYHIQSKIGRAHV